jgi:hypothetical protein
MLAAFVQQQAVTRDATHPALRRQILLKFLEFSDVSQQSASV